MPTGFESWADASLVPGTEVLFVKLYGVHTADTLRQWRQEVGAAWGGHCAAYVIDYSRCIVAASLAELADMQADEHQPKPSAVICSAAQWGLFLSLMRTLLARDQVRVPFQDRDSALRWAMVACHLPRAAASALSGQEASSLPGACAQA